MLLGVLLELLVFLVLCALDSGAELSDRALQLLALLLKLGDLVALSKKVIPS
jgi:hypothetical protein